MVNAPAFECHHAITYNLTRLVPQTATYKVVKNTKIQVRDDPTSYKYNNH